MTMDRSPIDDDDHGVLLHYLISINMVVDYMIDVFPVEQYHYIIGYSLFVQ